MIRRLVEQSYFSGTCGGGHPNFWLRRLRTPEILIEAAAQHPEVARQVAQERPAVQAAIEGNAALVGELLEAEEREQRAARPRSNSCRRAKRLSREWTTPAHCIWPRAKTGDIGSQNHARSF
jgi:hypothetical protein